MPPISFSHLESFVAIRYKDDTSIVIDAHGRREHWPTRLAEGLPKTIDEFSRVRRF
jgi:hypothetical protein